MVAANVKKGLVFGIGAFLVLVGGIIGGFWNEIYDSILTSELTLTSTSKSYDLWKDIPIPMYMDFYMYNWTNSEEWIEDPTVIPHFEELGPYVFSEHHTRVNITWNDNNNTVTYNQVRKWYFEPDKSSGSLDDEISNINVIAATTAYMARNLPHLFRLFISIFLNKTNSTLIVTKTARELLFEGYDDKLLDLANQLNSSLFKIPFKKFGYFVDRNNSATYDGVFNMHTGKTNLNELGLLTSWNYEQNTHYYGYPCNTVHGSSGELWPPAHDKGNVAIFAPDICTTLDLSYRRETEMHGISGLHYVGDDSTLDTGVRYKAKECQCMGECQPTGTLNVSLCRFNAPIFISFPHFYLADASYLAAVSGLMPDKDKHELTFALQPLTGIPLYANARLQINLMVEAFPDIEMFSNFKERVYLPALWFNQRVELDGDLMDEVKLIINLQTIGMGVLFGLAGIGALLLFLGTMLTIRHGWKGSESEHLLFNSE